MADKIATDGWLLWRMEEGEPKFFGLLPSEEAAKNDAKIIEEAGMGGWRISNVLLVGWAFNLQSGKVYTNKDPNPPTTKTRQ